MIISELCICALSDVIVKDVSFENDLLNSLSYQIVQAVHATHEAGFCHLDIKPENVLVSKDNTLKLCDFGSARSSDSVLSKRIGT